MFHFYNTCLNSLDISHLFSGGIIISSTFLGCLSITCFGFTILSSFDLATASAIFFPENLPALWTTFLEAVFKNSFQYLLDKFLDENSYSLTYFLLLVP